MSTMKTIEHSISVSTERVLELQKELDLIRSIDIDQLIRNREDEIRLENERLQYLRGLKAKVFGA